MRNELILTFVILMMCANVFGQPDSSVRYYLKNFEIYGTKISDSAGILKNEKFRYRDLTSAQNSGDTFLFRSEQKKNYKVPADQITKISIRNGSYILQGAGYGMLGGAALGFLLGSVANKSENSGHPSYGGDTRWAFAGAVVLGLTFGILGAVFGALTPDFEETDLRKYDKNKRSLKLKEILKKNSENEK